MRLGEPEEHGVLEDGDRRMESARRISRMDGPWAITIPNVKSEVYPAFIKVPM